MSSTIDIVSLIEKNPITKLSNTYNIKLLMKMKEKFNSYEQQLFLSSFYCYLNHDPINDFIIDLDNVWEFMGFNQKYASLRLLEKLFEKNIDYKIIFTPLGENSKKEVGRSKNKIFMNIKTFKLFCLKALTKKADEIHNYYINMEEIIQEVINDESQDIKKQLEDTHKIIEDKNKILEDKNKIIDNLEKELDDVKDEIPSIYVYNIDTTINDTPKLKIGYSLNVRTRIKSFKQISKNGKLEFFCKLNTNNIKIDEKYIHNLLSNYKIEGEVFKIDIETAKLIILRIIHTNKLLENKNDLNFKSNLQKIYDHEKDIINNTNHPKIFTNNISTQTDPELVENIIINNINPSIIKKKEFNDSFNKYIDECCILDNEAEVGSSEIIGNYRIWSKTASDEIFHSLKNYLDTRFRPERLKNQEKDQIVHGYVGVKLKEIKYTPKIENSDEQTFVFNFCVFKSEAKVLFSDLFKEYKHWKQTLDKN